MPILFKSSVILKEGDGPPINTTGSWAYMRGLIRGLRHIAVCISETMLAFALFWPS